MKRKINFSISRKFLITGCWVTAVILAGALSVLGVLMYKERTLRNNVRTHFTIEAGSKSVDASMFLITPSSHPVILLGNIANEQLSSPGNYQVVLYWQNRLFVSEITVADTIAPNGKPTKKTAIRDLPDPRSLVADISDFSDVTVSYVDLPNMSKAGTYPITVRLTDRYGNYRDVTSELTVIVDTDAPVIHCGEPKTFLLGETADYLSGITVTDDHDPTPTLTVDSSQVLIDTPGIYSIVYTATDASGNVSNEETVVYVAENSETVDVLSEGLNDLPMEEDFTQ